MSAIAGKHISEDLRYELVDAARVAETANRPRGMLILATLLFLGAGVALIVAIGERERAAADFRTQSERRGLVENLKLQAQAIEQQRDSAASRGNDRLPDLFSRIEDAARQAGLAGTPPIPDPTSTKLGGATRLQYQYTMREASLEALLSWVQRARENVPGLEVSAIEIVPEAKSWKFTVTFVRWERSS